MQTRLPFLIVAVACLGCSKASDRDQAASTVRDKVAQATLTAPSDGTPPTAEGPAQLDLASITVESPPEIICRAFIEYLRRGDQSKAEKFLSQESITQTRKQSLDLAMPADANSNYSISTPVFATNQKKIAFVTIEFTDAASGDSSPQSFSMMLKNGSFGWKIAGMMLGAENASQELYSFENPLDVLRIKTMLEGESRQARAPETESEIRVP